MSQGIQIHIPSGNPNGIRHIKLTGWDGKMYVIPRSKLSELRTLNLVPESGVYFLFGSAEESSKGKVYIGESDNFVSRLLTHDDSKVFWETAVVFSGSLDKADVKYLENKSIVLAKKVGRSDVINGNEPAVNNLSDFKRSAADEYFEKVKFVLAVLHYTIFQDLPTKSTSTEIFTFSDVRDKAGDAKGSLLESGEFIVYKDSLARIRETPAFIGTGGSLLRKRLETEGVLLKYNEQSMIFSKDYVFNSPSAASNTVSGRATNGWDCWRKDGVTLGELKRG